jgi:Tir chaperone protein (CesT) family
MPIASSEADFAKRLTDWIQSLNAAFGVSVVCTDGQCRFVSREAVEVILSASPVAGSLFMTAAIGALPQDDTRTVLDLMAKNLFQRQTNGGWFAFEPEDRTVCFQYRWDRYPIAELDEFLLVLQSFVQASESFARELKTAQPGTSAPVALDASATMIRV